MADKKSPTGRVPRFIGIDLASGKDKTHFARFDSEGRVVIAPPRGYSAHDRGVAFDMALEKEKLLGKPQGITATEILAVNNAKGAAWDKLRAGFYGEFSRQIALKAMKLLRERKPRTDDMRVMLEDMERNK